MSHVSTAGSTKEISTRPSQSMPVLGVQWHPERQAFALRRGEAADGAAVFWWLRRQAEKNSGG